MAILAACVVGSTSIALAQPPFVPDDWKFGKRQEPNTLHYCVDARDPDFSGRAQDRRRHRLGAAAAAQGST